MAKQTTVQPIKLVFPNVNDDDLFAGKVAAISSQKTPLGHFEIVLNRGEGVFMISNHEQGIWESVDGNLFTAKRKAQDRFNEIVLTLIGVSEHD